MKGKKPIRRNDKKDWALILEYAKRGELEKIQETAPDVYIRYQNSLRAIETEHARPTARPDNVVYCFWGDTGTGKTFRAFQEAGDVYYIKNPNTKWWDGYRGEHNIIIDEFTGTVNISYLLQWFDKYPCTVEVKGGQRILRGLKFWITSNIDPRDWYPQANEQQKEALIRRFASIVHFSKDNIFNRS